MKNKKPKKPFEELDKLMANKLEKQNEIKEYYTKLSEFIQPFIKDNKEMEKLDSMIKTRLMLLPIDDLVINTSMMVMNLSIREQMSGLKKNWSELVKEMNLPKEMFENFE